MSETGHTPTPWVLRECKGHGFDQIDGADGFTICDVDALNPYKYGIANVGEYAESPRQRKPRPGECEANAALIVKAVNSHAQLVEALKRIEQFARPDHRNMDGLATDIAIVWNIATEAIRMAEGEPLRLSAQEGE